MHNFSYVVPGKLAGMARPGRYDDLDADLAALREHGIGAVVSLTEAPLDADALSRAGLESIHIPVDDFMPPTQGQIRRFVEYVEEMLERGTTVVVHCGAGVGRTGTMLACWLVREGADPETAVAEIRRLRPGSVETQQQVEAVRAYASASGG